MSGPRIPWPDRETTLVEDLRALRRLRDALLTIPPDEPDVLGAVRIRQRLLEIADRELERATETLGHWLDNQAVIAAGRRAAEERAEIEHLFNKRN